MKRFLTIIFLSVIGVLVIILTNPFTYKRITYVPQQNIGQITEFEVDPDDVYELIYKVNGFVCHTLSFSKHNDLSKNEANCVGYSQYYSYLFNHNAKKNHINAIAKPTRGYVYHFLDSVNINKLLVKLFPKHKNFVKDHDYVEIYYEGKYLTVIDPSLNDLRRNYYY